MSQNSNKKHLSLIVPVLAGLLVAKVFWVAIDYKYLPKEGIDKEEKSKIKPLYYRYSLASKKEAPKAIVKKEPKIKVPIKKPKPKPLKIKKFILKGIIYENENRGIVTVEYANKSYVLAKGEELEGFKVYKFTPKSVIFTKDDKEYEVKLFDKKKEPKVSRVTEDNRPKKKAPKPTEKKDKEIIQEGDTTIISKNLFNKYKKDMASIRKSIGVAPVMENNKLKGFRIRYIKKGSDFEKVGVKTGDIITAINGEEINDLSVPINFFNNLDNISNATITIKRGNEEKELEYEVR